MESCVVLTSLDLVAFSLRCDLRLAVSCGAVIFVEVVVVACAMPALAAGCLGGL